MAVIFGGEEIFVKFESSLPCGLKNLTKSLYLTRLRRQKQISVSTFWQKIRIFKMAAIFGESKFFLKIAYRGVAR